MSYVNVDVSVHDSEIDEPIVIELVLDVIDYPAIDSAYSYRTREASVIREVKMRGYHWGSILNWSDSL